MFFEISYTSEKTNLANVYKKKNCLKKIENLKLQVDTNFLSISFADLVEFREIVIKGCSKNGELDEKCYFPRNFKFATNIKHFDENLPKIEQQVNCGNSKTKTCYDD